MICPKCKKEVPQESEFCNHCGAALNCSTVSNKKRNEKNSLFPVILMISAFVILAVAVCIFVFGDFKDDASAGNAGTSQTSSNSDNSYAGNAVTSQISSIIDNAVTSQITSIIDNAVTSQTSSSAVTITLSEYNSIDNGMTYEEVAEIVGGAGAVLSEVGEKDSPYYTVCYSYKGLTPNANACFIFQNGKMQAKSQFGLTD